MGWFWILLLGAVGVAARFTLDTWVSRFIDAFPAGTLSINIAGCLVAGVLFGLGGDKPLADTPLRLGAIVGFCGGFTTFSGFALQIMQLLGSGRLSVALAYGVATPILCILAAAAGLYLTRV